MRNKLARTLARTLAIAKLAKAKLAKAKLAKAMISKAKLAEAKLANAKLAKAKLAKQVSHNNKASKTLFVVLAPVSLILCVLRDRNQQTLLAVCSFCLRAGHRSYECP